MTGARGRFPARLFRDGTEPDARFTLANERTFLAWVRTALALIAGGVALESLGLRLEPHLRLAASLVLVVAGIVTAVQGWAGWYDTERRMRLRQPLRPARASLLVAGAAALAGLLVLLATLLR